MFDHSHLDDIYVPSTLNVGKRQNKKQQQEFELQAKMAVQSFSHKVKPTISSAYQWPLPSDKKVVKKTATSFNDYKTEFPSQIDKFNRSEEPTTPLVLLGEIVIEKNIAKMR